MADIRINQLPLDNTPVSTDFVPLDNGTTRKTTIATLVEIGRPVASQAEAEAAVNNTKVMTPLTVNQAVAFYGLTKAGNLSGLVNVIAARGNLGLGDSATRNVGTTAGTVAAGDDTRIVNSLQTSAIGTTVQAFDTDLTAIAALTSAANKLPYATGAGTWAVTDFTAFARTLVDDPNASTALTTIGLGTVLAVNDGTTDNAATWAAAAATTTIFLAPGTYVVGSNTTINAKVIALPGAVIKPSASVTVTFANEIDAGPYRLFDLSAASSAIAGLRAARMEWFVEHLRGSASSPPVTNARPLIQSAVNAVVNDGTLYAGQGVWLLDGTVITFTGQSFVGAGRNDTFFLWSGTTTNGFSRINAGNGLRGGCWKGFRMGPSVPGTIPTAGKAVYVNQSDITVSDVYIEDCFDGIDYDTVVGGFVKEFEIRGARNIGLRTNNLNDVFISDYIIDAANDWVTVNITSGTAFNLGETVSTTSGTGSNGTVVAKYSNTSYRIGFIGRMPQVGSVLTGQTSGAVGTITAITVGHAFGGIRWSSKNEAVTLERGDTIGGLFSFTCAGTGSPGRTGNSYGNRMADSVYFDTPYNGASTDGLTGCIIDAWFASARNQDANGLALVNARMIRCRGHFVNNSGGGIVWDSTCRDIELIGADFDGNCVDVSPGSLASMGEIRLLGAPTRWKIIGGRAGFQGENGITPVRALYINAGAANDFKVIGFQVPTTGTPIQNGATGANQVWLGVEGMDNRRRLADIRNAANDAAAAALVPPVPVGGEYRNGSVVMVRVV